MKNYEAPISEEMLVQPLAVLMENSINGSVDGTPDNPYTFDE